MPRYPSLTTEGVKHDEANLLAEICLLNKFGYINPGSWRKGSEYCSEWKILVQAIKRIVNTLNISFEQLAWYIASYKVTDIPYKEFGLLHFKINKRFKSLSIKDIYNIYLNKKQTYSIINTSYQTKDVGLKNKSLMDILEEI